MTATTPRLTDAELAALVRRNNPFVHGKRDTLLRQRELMAQSPFTTPAELAEMDAEIARWNERVASYEGGNWW